MRMCAKAAATAVAEQHAPHKEMMEGNNTPCEQANPTDGAASPKKETSNSSSSSTSACCTYSNPTLCTSPSSNSSSFTESSNSSNNSKCRNNSANSSNTDSSSSSNDNSNASGPNSNSSKTGSTHSNSNDTSSSNNKDCRDTSSSNNNSSNTSRSNNNNNSSDTSNSNNSSSKTSDSNSNSNNTSGSSRSSKSSSNKNSSTTSSISSSSSSESSNTSNSSITTPSNNGSHSSNSISSTGVTASLRVNEADQYSRLTALQRIGVVENYAAIREKTVAIVGVGGVGAVAAEMLTRCGVGRLLLFDCDRVEAANMNRLFFRPCHIGCSKVQAAREMLHTINPDVDVQIFDCDVCSDFDTLLNCLAEKIGDSGEGSSGCSSGTTSSSDALCSGVSDQLSASKGGSNTSNNNTNNKASSRDTLYSSRDGSDSSITEQECHRKPAVDLLLSCVDNYTARITISQACNQTGLLVQNALKMLLRFGEVSPLLSFDSVHNFFYSLVLKPSPFCADPWCQLQQRKAKEKNLSLDTFLHFSARAPEEDADENHSGEFNEGLCVLAEGEESGSPPPSHTLTSDGKLRASNRCRSSHIGPATTADQSAQFIASGAGGQTNAGDGERANVPENLHTYNLEQLKEELEKLQS